VERGLAPPLSLLVVAHVDFEPILPRGIEIGVFPSFLKLFLFLLLFFRLFRIVPAIPMIIIRLVFMAIMTTAPTAGRVFTDFARGGNSTSKVRLGHGQSVIQNQRQRKIFFVFLRKKKFRHSAFFS